MNDIKNKADIKIFVDRFYGKVRKDMLIGPIFNSKIAQARWPAHLEKMYGFWNTILFGKPEYRGNPFSHHIPLNIGKEHFDRWVLLLTTTISENFKGAKADEVVDRGNKMRLMFESKLEHLRSRPDSHPIM